jgi:formate-dependent nitrite reductase membrane component NrfD
MKSQSIYLGCFALGLLVSPILDQVMHNGHQYACAAVIVLALALRGGAMIRGSREARPA